MTETRKNLFKDTFLFIFVALSIVGINYYFNPKNLAMQGINPHPLLVLSVLFSAYRGFKFSFIASISSALVYFGLYLSQVDFQEVEDVYSLENIIFPITMIIISVLVGDLQQRTLSRVSFWKSKFDENRNYHTKLEEKQEILEKEIHHLKKKIVTKLDTIKSLHESAVKLNSLNVEQLTENFMGVVNERVDVKKAYFYIYNNEEEKFEFASPSSASIDEIESYSIEDDLTVAMAIKQKKMITIRNLLSAEKVKEDFKGALIAYPVFYNDDLYGVYVVLDMPFLEFVPQNINIIAELVGWFEESLNVAINYEASEVGAEADIRFKAYKYKYFKKRISEEMVLAQTYNIPLFVLKVSLSNLDQASQYKQRMLKKFVIEFFRSGFRSIDPVCLGRTDDEILVILLSDRVGIFNKVASLRSQLKLFNLVINESNTKLDIHFALSELKDGYKKVEHLLTSFEKVS